MIGATLLLLSLWLAAISLFAGVSWLAVMDTIGKRILDSSEKVRDQFMALKAKAALRQVKEKRHVQVREKREKAEEKARTKIAPKIEPVVNEPEVSVRAEKERQVPLFEPGVAGELPPLSILNEPPPKAPGYSTEALEGMSRLVEMKLADFGVEVQVVAVKPGPVVTRFELDPAGWRESGQNHQPCEGHCPRLIGGFSARC